MAFAPKRDVTSAAKPAVAFIAKPAVAPKAAVAVAPKSAVAVAPKSAVVVAPKPAVTVAFTPAVTVAPKPAVTVALKPAMVVASRPNATALSRPVAVFSPGFGTMETSANLYFAGELKAPVKHVGALTPSNPAKSIAATIHSHVISTDREATPELEIELADELIPFDDGFAVTAPIRKPSSTAVKLSFEPLEVDYEFYVGTAFELNFRNDGLERATDSVIRTVKNDTSAKHPTPDLSRAVKLTREAVYAWVNVFTGPALVTVSQGR